MTRQVENAAALPRDFTEIFPFLSFQDVLSDLESSVLDHSLQNHTKAQSIEMYRGLKGSITIQK